MTKQVMVDLETWGRTPGSDIRSIGAVVFDPVAGTLGDEFYIATENELLFPATDNQAAEYRYPLTRESETEQWWSEQSPEAQSAFTDPVDLAEALGRFQIWWGSHEEDGDYTRFWAHGPHFDEQILAACFRATGMIVPWSYRAPRDLRTMLEAAGLDPKGGIPSFGVAHNALHDAKAQALAVIDAHRRIAAWRAAA